MPCSNRLLEVHVAIGFRVLCSNRLCMRVLLGFLGFAHKVNEFGPFCGDSIILWPNFGSSVISIFVKTQVG